MCDYSLMMLPSRLAVEGDRLVAHRFRSGTTGLVSYRDFENWMAARPVRLWQKLKDCFSCEKEPGPLVCIPPGARLRLEDIPANLARAVLPELKGGRNLYASVRQSMPAP